MTTTAHLTAAADQLATELANRRAFHDGEPCDALAPCEDCRRMRLGVQVRRRLAEVPVIPAQRTAVGA